MRTVVVLMLATVLAGCAMEPVAPTGAPTGVPSAPTAPPLDEPRVTPTIREPLPSPPTPSPTVPLPTPPSRPSTPTPTPPAPTPPALVARFHESFDSGLAAWTIERGDARTDCEVAYADCSLRVRPPCCGPPYSDVHRTVNVSLPATLNVRFLATSLVSDHDQHLEIFFGSGAQYIFDVTAGPTPDNNGVTLRGPDGDTGVFVHLPAANEWYSASIAMDDANDRIGVLIRDADGKPLGARSLPLPSGETYVSWVRFRSVDHAPSGVDHHWDELRIEPPARDRVLSDGWDDALLGDWTVENASASVQCASALGSCALQVAPTCCRGYVDVSRVVDVPLPASVSVDFRGSSATGSLDAHFELFTSRGTQYVFDITNGDNNGIRLLGPNGVSTGDIARWTRTNEWHTASLDLDPARGVVTVTIRDPDGATVSSGQVALPRGEDTLAWLRFRAAEHGTPGLSAFYWDDVHVEAR